MYFSRTGHFEKDVIFAADYVRDILLQQNLDLALWTLWN
jgi:hypothetical protein